MSYLKYFFLFIFFFSITYSAFSEQWHQKTWTLSQNTAYNNLKNENLDHSMKQISETKYLAGGIASIFVGLGAGLGISHAIQMPFRSFGLIGSFGLGHAVQGRYLEKGWIFTLTSILSIAVSFSGPLIAKALNRPYVFLTLLRVLMLAPRVWEIIDAWVLPSNYKITRLNLKITPTTYYSINNPSKRAFGLSLSYQF